MGRPQKQIDKKQIEKLATIGCTIAEMAAVLDCSERTLYRRFGSLIEKGKLTGNMSLRHKQFQTALAGNVTMQIWLGKQRLEQKDKHEVGAEDNQLAEIVKAINGGE